jgi:flagellar biosynthesis/type III secretory pathway protein FliH
LQKKGRLFLEAKGVKTSLSRLIKSGEAPLYQINSYDAQDMGGEGEEVSSDRERFVMLPVSGGSSACDMKGPIGARRGKERESEENIKERLARLEKEAYEKGFEQGRKDGLALEKRQLEEKGKQWEALFSELRTLKERIYLESEEDLLRLSTLIARQIIREEARTDTEMIRRTIHAAYKFLVDKSSIKILINRDDMEEVRQILPELASMTKGGRFQVVEDDVLTRGGCLLETGFGSVNATIEDQLWMLEKEIKEAFTAFHGENP